MREWFVAHYDVWKDFAGPAVTLIGFAVTTTLAIVGLNTFGRWKKEKIEEKRIDVAIEALACAYEAKFVFEAIRFRLVRDYEYQDMNLNGDSVIVLDERRKNQGGPYAVLKRLEHHEEFFERVRKLEPKFMAVFGGDTEEIFSLLFGAKSTVVSTAEALIDEYRVELDATDTEGRERRKRWRSIVFASPGKIEPDDDVGTKVLEFKSLIEKRCRPIVDREFRS